LVWRAREGRRDCGGGWGLGAGAALLVSTLLSAMWVRDLRYWEKLEDPLSV
jgi:hypothetical protein